MIMTLAMVAAVPSDSTEASLFINYSLTAEQNRTNNGENE